MKLKNKGFTLVELLAVIVILAIIAVIAVPQVLKLIENSRKDAFTATTRSLVKAAKLQYVKDVAKGNTDYVVYDYSDSSGKRLDIDGEEPSSGYVAVDSSGKITMSVCDKAGYCVSKLSSKEEVVEIPQKLIAIKGGVNFATANDGEKKWNIEYNSSNKTAKITGADLEDDVTEVIIPKSFVVDGVTYNVTEIKADSFRDNEFQNIVVPEGIINIGAYAFYGAEYNKGCKYLVLPRSLEIIYHNSFWESDTSLKTYIKSNVLCGEEDPEPINNGWNNCFGSADNVILY